jgi:hypothetical protein
MNGARRESEDAVISMIFINSGGANVKYGARCEIIVRKVNSQVAQRKLYTSNCNVLLGARGNFRVSSALNETSIFFHKLQ